MNNEALNYGADRRRGYKNISSTDVPGLQDGHTKNTYYYQNVNNNNGEYESSNSASMKEDELDGLEALEDPQQRPNYNEKPNGFSFGSKASSFQNKYAIVCWIIVISSCIIVSM